jgi:hypothetical protein
MSSGKFYMRDTRQVVGNCLLWWRKGRNGYTTNIDDAHVFTEDEAAIVTMNRPTDVAYPVEDVKRLAKRCVDHQSDIGRGIRWEK